MAINTTSSIKTPQAGDDTFYTTEDFLTSGQVMTLDVMSNDLGGKAKTLWSIASDDGNPLNLEDLSSLLAADVQNVNGGSAWETTSEGNLIRIFNGQLEYKLGSTPEAIANVNSLAEGEVMQDTFTYSIRLANGTLSLATVTVQIVGTNDAPTLAAVTSSSVAEVDQSPNTTESGLSGSLVGNDVDNGAILTYGIQGGSASSHGDFDVELAGNFGTLYVNSASGAYEFVKNAAAVEAMDDTETGSDIFTVTVSDGDGPDVTQTYTINVSGADDAPTLAAVTSGSVAEVDQSASTTDSALTGTLAGDDVDVETLTYGIQGGSASSHGDFDVELAGNFGTLYVNSTTGAYEFVKNAAAVEAMDDTETGSDIFTVTVSDGDGPDVTQTYTVNVSGANDAPVISSPNSGNAVALNVAENTANTVVVVDVNATDVDIESISYSLTGDDALLFNINSATGEVTFKNAPDFETPLDSGGNNIYNFTVVASDGSASDTQNVAITVTDVPESTGPTIAPVYNGTGDPNDFDSLVGTASSGFLLVNGTIAGETITGDTSANDKDIINALGGDDTVYAGDATDTVYGGDGIDTIYGGDQNDSLYGQAGNDTINGDANNDAIYGGSGNDILNGNANGDNIFGGSGNDILNGGDGNDSLTGGYGADNLTGGAGADTFMFVSALDIGDVISDFIAADDTLDFSGIDANSTTGANDAFIAATNSSTVVANSINYFQSGSDTIVWADTDGDTSTVEFQVTLSNVTASLLTNNDFTL